MEIKNYLLAALAVISSVLFGLFKLERSGRKKAEHKNKVFDKAEEIDGAQSKKIDEIKTQEAKNVEQKTKPSAHRSADELNSL